ncbi:MAG TPA: hypothetical protein VNN80_27605, partial [Polyangiaceae bacterium]|nr:hypothetical protein [Polyangiaceae bacterium]
GAEVFQLGAKCALPPRLWRLVHAAVPLVLALHAQAAAANDGWNENDAELAEDPKPAPPLPPAQPPAQPSPPLTPVDRLLTASLVYEVELRAAIGRGLLADDDGSLAKLTTGGVDLVFTMGGFVDPHLKMGYEATAGQRAVLASRPGEQPSGYYPSKLEVDARYILPFGGYAAFYPLGDAGLSLGADFGVGILSKVPPFMGSGFLIPALAGTAAVNVGYDRVWSDHLAWGVRARCGRLGFSNSDDDGHTTALSSTELTLAIHVGAF